MIRTLLCAPRGIASSTIAPSTARVRQVACWIVITSAPPLEDPGLQGLPFRIVLRVPVLAAIVVEVAAGLLGQRVHEQPALGHAARHDHPLHSLEVLARVLVAPGCAARGQRLETQ